MQNLLQFLTKSIVRKPEEVEVYAQETEQGWVNLTIRANTEDIGTIIGKGGCVIKALQNIVKIKAIKENKGVNVGVVESENF
jgi:predicted RNA-binding protein YlqC (UPF0109 family)